jgi:glutamate dehydrogenase/leucine dehydrogenase
MDLTSGGSMIREGEYEHLSLHAEALRLEDEGLTPKTWKINGRLQAIMLDAFRRTLDRATTQELDMRTAALIEGIARVTHARSLRGLFP